MGNNNAYKVASDNLSKTSNLVMNFQNEVPEVAQKLSERLATLGLDLEGGRNPIAVVRECEVIRTELTGARCRKVWNDVNAADLKWRNSSFAKPYIDQKIAQEAMEWLLGDCPSPKTPIKDTLTWIGKGKGFCLQLRVPWSKRCKCGKVVFPRQVRGEWVFYDLCGDCYHRSKTV